MKYLIISILALLTACASNPTGPTGTQNTKIYFHAYDYAHNFFMLDTSYQGVFTEYYKTAIPVLPPNASNLRIKEIEVWMNGVIQDTGRPPKTIAYADLPSIKSAMGEKYPDSMLNAKDNPGNIINQYFVINLDSTKYKIDFNLGILTIFNFDSNAYYAVAYRTEGPTQAANDDDFTGTMTSNGIGTKDTLILKLLYSPNIQPDYTSLWERQLKNFYTVPVFKYYIRNIRVYYINHNNDTLDVLDSLLPDKLVTILGVDRFDSTGNQKPDGKFDLQLPFLDRDAGTIMFPNLQPFIESIKQYFFSINRRDLIQNYVFGEIYNAPPFVAASDKDKDRYLIIIEAGVIVNDYK